MNLDYIQERLSHIRGYVPAIRSFNEIGHIDIDRYKKVYATICIFFDGTKLYARTSNNIEETFRGEKQAIFLLTNKEKRVETIIRRIYKHYETIASQNDNH